MVIALLILLTALQVGDILTTLRAIHHGGRELNPVVGWFIARLGLVAGLALVKVLGFAAIATAALTFKAYAPVPLALLCAGYVWLVWHNWKVV